jgi:hypothetical protein
VAFLALAAALAVPRSAQAVLDPAQAAGDVRDAMREKAYPFCSAPHEPLSREALELCPQATEIPGCEGFAAACARVTEPRHLPSMGEPWAGLSALVGTLAQATVWLVVGALLLAILVPIIRALGRLRREEKEDEPASRAPQAADSPQPVPLPNSDEEELLRRAAALAAQGENAAALELYLAASLRALDKRGAVRLAPHRTNGEYVRACADLAAKPGLRDIVREVDRVKFGGAVADGSAVERAAQRAFSIVRALPAAMLALAVLALTGCGGSPARAHRAGDDPAGLELFREVLHRQGVPVTPLATSLATMPLPSADESSPAVVVDVERTPLDEDTSAHLVEWVEAGGVLVLAGSPAEWPSAFHATRATPGGHKITARTLISREGTDGDDDDSPKSENPVYGRTEQEGHLALGRGVTFRGSAQPAAWFEDTTIYAAAKAYGHGYLVGIASDELLTNAGLARPGNAAAMIAILSNADRQSFAVAEPDDGVAPPSTPLAAMTRAGMGVGMAHALLASIVLFLAAGIRLARPRPAAPPLRRAFSEHVEAVGALYAQTRSAPHALAVYARFADERLRATMLRQGGTDVPAFLASRARMPLDRCQRLWARAVEAKAGAPPQGDELAVLKELAAVYSAATAQGT